MSVRGRWVKVGAAVVMIGAVSAGTGAMAADAPDDTATGPAAASASDAAVAHVGGGQATGIERESEGNVAWEVEVTRGGSVFEVKLDDRNRVVSQEDETNDERSDEPDDRESAGEDRDSDEPDERDDDRDGGLLDAVDPD
jgi:hypothetical protein